MKIGVVSSSVPGHPVIRNIGSDYTLNVLQVIFTWETPSDLHQTSTRGPKYPPLVMDPFGLGFFFIIFQTLFEQNSLDRFCKG